MAKWYRNGGAMLYTKLRNGGRISGCGMLYDDYGADSGYHPGAGKHATEFVRMPRDKEDPRSLNGPVIIVQPAKK